MSNTFSKFSNQEKIHIWSLIQEGKSLQEISTIYSKYNRNIDFGVRNGRQWNDITNLNPIFKNSKRVGYTCRNGLYMVRKIIDELPIENSYTWRTQDVKISKAMISNWVWVNLPIETYIKFLSSWKFNGGTFS